MCGIFGHTRARSGDLERSRRALHTLEHRGPDQWGDWFDERVYSGHRRLSILDLSDHGRQPMILDRAGARDEAPAEPGGGDATVVLAANGEIYNYRELRHELGLERFTSDGDSEVLLHGYRTWGIDGLLQRLDGMFAFAIYDRVAGRIHLARDRFGIKPLYWASHRGTLAWASELKALESLFEGQLEPDPTALYDFLTYLYVPTPKTLYREVYKLAPATRLEIDVATLDVQESRYWKLVTGNDREAAGKSGGPSVQEAAEELRARVRSAVNAQMVSDVPLGFFLSGGIDSSAVVADAVQLSSDVHTYTIGFDDAAHDESSWARRIAELCGTQHNERTVAVEDVAALFPKLLDWYDEPFGDTSAFPTYVVSQLAREQVKVVLTGDGGDEVFGGYRRYEQFRRYRQWSFANLAALRPLTGGLQRSLKGGSLVGRLSARFERTFIDDEFELLAHLMGGLEPRARQRWARALGVPDDYDPFWYWRRYYRPELPVMQRLAFLDLHTYLHDDILTKVDRTTMAVSLEARVPLLAHSLVEYAYQLPVEILYDGDLLKGLMKTAYAGDLPDEVLHRRKRGFSIPMRRWGEQLLADGETRQERILHELFSDALPPGAGRSLAASATPAGSPRRARS